MDYHHVQWGWFGVPVLLLFAVISVPLSMDDELSTTFVVVMAAFMLGIFALVMHFSRLKVTVGGGRVVSSFGSGKPKRVIDLADVTAVRRVRNQWWYGWGVRKIPNGWMYNVWGLDAVELELGSSKVFRIGSDEPDQLTAVLSLHVRK